MTSREQQEMRLCAVIPTYDNPLTVWGVVERVREQIPDVFVVDDGSAPECRTVLEQLASRPGVRVHHSGSNNGKGAAVKLGLALAQAQGFSHALQVDADGQHDLGCLSEFIQSASDNPEQVILGYPRFDSSVPKGRLVARQLTVFWCAVETLGRTITDPMCGLRVYPIAQTLQTQTPADRMDFDPEVAVRLVWQGVGVRNLPVTVRYLSEQDGGVSHYHLLFDTLRITWMHWRLMIRLIWGRGPRRAKPLGSN